MLVHFLSFFFSFSSPHHRVALFPPQSRVSALLMMCRTCSHHNPPTGAGLMASQPSQSGGSTPSSFAFCYGALRCCTAWLSGRRLPECATQPRHVARNQKKKSCRKKRKAQTLYLCVVSARVPCLKVGVHAGSSQLICSLPLSPSQQLPARLAGGERECNAAKSVCENMCRKPAWLSRVGRRACRVPTVDSQPARLSGKKLSSSNSTLSLTQLNPTRSFPSPHPRSPCGSERLHCHSFSSYQPKGEKSLLSSRSGSFSQPPSQTLGSSSGEGIAGLPSSVHFSSPQPHHQILHSVEQSRASPEQRSSPRSLSSPPPHHPLFSW